MCTTAIRSGVLAVALVTSGCVTFAAPPPLLTAGGPSVAAAKHSEVAAAVGTGLALFPDAHSGGMGWMGRFRRGLGGGWDIGVDAMGAAHGSTGTFNFKVAPRYQLRERLRLEGGLGAADNSDGKSVSAELAVTVGGNRDRTWNHYFSLRGAAAKGLSPGVLGPNPDNEPAPPDTFFGLVNLGTTARVAPNQKLFFEGGFGYIFPDGEPAGALVFWGVGLQFTVGD